MLETLVLKGGRNARKKTQSEQILGKLREVEVALAQGETLALAVRQIGVTDHTHSSLGYRPPAPGAIMPSLR